MSQEYQTFAYRSSILGDIWTPQKEILDGCYAKQKWTRWIQKTIFEMYALLIVINI